MSPLFENKADGTGFAKIGRREKTEDCRQVVTRINDPSGTQKDLLIPDFFADEDGQSVK